MSVYLRPWVLHRDMVSAHVPHITELHAQNESWRASWKKWNSGHLLSERSRQIVTNFQAVFSLRQEDSVSDDASKRRDTTLTLSREQMMEALHTSQKRCEKAAQDENAPGAFELAEALWGDVVANVKRRKQLGNSSDSFQVPANLATVLKAARASQRKDPTKQATSHTHNEKEQTPTLHVVSRGSRESSIRHQQSRLQTQCRNEKQKEVVRIVADRMIQEEHDLLDDRYGESDPLSVMVCGGPGTGKSHVTTSLKELFEAVGWKQGQEFQFAAFQAVVADQVVRGSVSTQCLSLSTHTHTHHTEGWSPHCLFVFTRPHISRWVATPYIMCSVSMTVVETLHLCMQKFQKRVIYLRYAS